MKLTVVIPTFNRVRLLSEAIDSILSQSIAVHEIVIVDDASNDDTQSFCQKLTQEKRSTSVVFIRNDKNCGAQVCRNIGWQLSTGDAILFMDSDDVLTKNGVQPLLQELEINPNLDYVFGKVVRTDSQLQPLANLEPVGSSFSTEPREIAGYHWHTMGAIYRKEYLRQVGLWNEDLTGSQDWEFQARVKLAGGQGKFIEHTVGFWRDHSNDRVGTKKFRHDYVTSVIKACLVIRDKSRETGIADSSLERRLAKKMVFHALEFAVNGYRKERCQSLSYAIETLHTNPIMQFVVRCWRVLSSSFDWVLWKLIHLNYETTV